MRVSVTLSNTNVGRLVRVPETWDKFMHVLRDRFGISDDSKLIVAIPGKLGVLKHEIWLSSPRATYNNQKIRILK